MGHEYDWAGQIAIGAFALATGFLVWKTGGLELAILIHTANNLVLFLFAPFSPSSMEQGSVNPLFLLIDLPLLFGVTLAMSMWVSRTHGLRFWEPVRGNGKETEATSPVRELVREQAPAFRSVYTGGE